MILKECRKKTAVKKRIAFLGGAFDPPHPGHEMLARKVLDLNLSDVVLWVPSWSSPHKNAGKMTAFEHRLAMVRLIAEKIPGCEVSDIEARCAFDPSYSYRVLSALQDEYPECELQLLIGQDSLEQLHLWYCARELAAKYEIIAFPRRRADGDDGLCLPIDFWGSEMVQKLQKSLVAGEFVEISSTDLRKELAKTGNMQHIIPDEILHYIKEHGLYR